MLLHVSMMQSVTVLCRLPIVAEVIKQHGACSTTKSLESVVSAEDRSMLRRALAGARQLSRYDVHVSVVEYGAEGDTVDAARVEMLARHRKKTACRRRHHERRIMSANTRRQAMGEEMEEATREEGTERTIGKKGGEMARIGGGAQRGNRQVHS